MLKYPMSHHTGRIFLLRGLRERINTSVMVFQDTLIRAETVAGVVLRVEQAEGERGKLVGNP